MDVPACMGHIGGMVVSKTNGAVAVSVKGVLAPIVPAVRRMFGMFIDDAENDRCGSCSVFYYMLNSSNLPESYQ